MSDNFIQSILLQTRGFTKKKIYAWVLSNGEILAKSENFEELSKLSKTMQVIADDKGYDVRLIEFGMNSTKIRITPNIDPEEEPLRGGHAIGGFNAQDINDIESEFKRIFYRQYSSAKETKFWIEEKTAYAEYKNVRCWVTLLDDPQTDGETGLKNRWKACVTMIKDWNSDYHDVHLGDFYDGTNAVEKAFLGFLKFQITEQTIDDFF